MNSSYYKAPSGIYIPKDADYMTRNPWETRIAAANKFFEEWEGKFRCKLLEEYYEGFHWKQRRDYPTTNYNPYTINLFYSTIKIKLSALLFQRPKFLISPTPGNSNWNLDFAVQSAQLKEDVLNSIVHNMNVNFKKHVKLCALDSMHHFGIMEVGYANDWRNPQKVDPQLKSWDDSNVTQEEDKVVDDNDVPVNERFYVKRIQPRRFRVCVSEACDLNDHDWVGYYDYYYTRTLQNTKGIKWPSNYTGGSYVGAEYASGFMGSDKDDLFKQLYASGEISKVWHIWDMISHQRLLLLEDDAMHELFSTSYEHLPLVDLRWDLRSKGFYPIPVTFNWISPQDEINEAREQTRSYRRRFTRKFQSVKGSVAEEEKEKFSSGPDGIIIEVKQTEAITPIQNPEQGPTTENALIIAKDDFNIISGTSAEARGQASDRETATQAKIVDVRSQIRESAEQLDFADWLCLIGRELLVMLQDRLVEGLWVKYSADPGGETQEQQQQGPIYQYVTSQQISDGYDYEVEFDVQNATPAAMQAAQQAFINFNALIAQYPMISMNPALIREAAYRVGYRNEMIIKEMQQTALQMAQMKAQEMAQQGRGQGQQGSSTLGQTRAAQMTTPSQQQISTQLASQLQ